MSDAPRRDAQQARYREARAIIVEVLLWLAIAYGLWTLLDRIRLP